MPIRFKLPDESPFRIGDHDFQLVLGIHGIARASTNPRDVRKLSGPNARRSVWSPTQRPRSDRGMHAIASSRSDCPIPRPTQVLAKATKLVVRSAATSTRPGPCTVRESASDQSRRWRQPMEFASSQVSQMNDADVQRGQYVGDDPAVTPPPQDLGAHHHRSQTTTEEEQLGESFREFLGRDVIGVGPKRWMAPAEVDRGCARASPASQLRNPPIGYPGARQRAFQRRSGKLRQAARSRKPPHVDHQLDVMMGKDAKELRASAGRVTNRPDRVAHLANTASLHIHDS